MTKATSLPTRLKRKHDLERAVRYLVKQDKHLAQAFRASGAPYFKMRPAGFASLLKIIVEQQLSTASANAIWGRCEDLLPDMTPDCLLACADDDLRALGLSRPKIRYARALANEITKGHLNLTHLARMSDANAMQALQSVTGIGRWTAEIYCLFCLGRPDVWPAGDIAVQAAYQSLHGLDARPSVQDFDGIAEQWRPVRGVAALILWNYYRHVKKRPIWK